MAHSKDLSSLISKKGEGCGDPSSTSEEKTEEEGALSPCCQTSEIVEPPLKVLCLNPPAKKELKGYICCLFFMSKREHLWNKEKCFLLHFESSFRSWDNQILNFQIFKCHDIIKCLSMKHETHFIE